MTSNTMVIIQWNVVMQGVGLWLLLATHISVRFVWLHK